MGSFSVSIFGKFLRFSGVGVLATGVQYGILVLLVQFGVAEPAFASAVGFVVSACVNYLLNYHVTFASKKPHVEAASKFVGIAALGLTLNTIIMALGTRFLTVHYVLVQVAATVSVLVWNFTGNYLWSFRETESEEP